MAKKVEKLRAALKRPGPKAGDDLPALEGPSGVVLDRLWSVILKRRSADPSVSHSARLLSRGTAKVAQKFGEESVECLIEAVGGNPQALVAESADVLYHLLVLWVSCGVEPAMIWAELERREGVSGVAEKAARSLPLLQGGRTRKIP
jgi:phosphoribosyl-ATP pyrophosphohydrolase